MIKETPEIKDLDIAIHKANEIIKANPVQASELLKLRKRLESMKAASLELESLRDDFERGNVTSENYRIQSKKLRTDVERSRNEANLISIINMIEKKEKRSRLTRLKDSIVSNKDFVLFVLEIFKTLSKP